MLARMATTITPATRARRYAERRYRGLDQRLVHALESRLVLRYVDELAGRGEEVLDMPCGYGRFTGPLLRRGLVVSAGDADRARLDLLGELVEGEVPVRCLRSEALPFDDASFDATVCVRLLQHLKDPDQRRRTLAELARVSRRGVVATVYMRSAVHGAVHSARRQARLAHYDRAGLLRDLAAAGLRIRRMARPIPLLHAQTVLQLVPAGGD